MATEPKEWKWKPLPPEVNVETPQILKKALEAQQYLSELKGISYTIPNQQILLNTLPIQEAKDSSEIENIVTTSDALYRADVEKKKKIDHTTKEVQRYAIALNEGFNRIKEDGILRTNDILSIQKEIEDNDAGIRSLPGTKLSNPVTGEVVFVPPQNKEVIQKALDNLEQYINNDDLSAVHPLIKMAVIHVHFESIHPFYDGNGRTGRIINMLYLVQKGLLDLPVFYLSRYIVRNKPQYYQLLQRVRTHNDWENWILYMLEGVKQTSIGTIEDIILIRDEMMNTKHQIRSRFSFYSQDLINHIFRHPYSKINHLMEELNVSRPTATKYLDELSGAGFLDKVKQGRDNYYINRKLLEILTDNRL
ncbi:MAG: Fic family protein [Balneolaceae bacterium]